ncbi:MAG: DegT/DnrJ/EryC1/StrS aminotransferase family protein [Cytophagales bacterium]|nr:DegT/DnrJ/EryC1/StrS aminotransferase family protein [Cytophagales bacterium]
MEYTYPVYRPSLDGREAEYVNECLRSNWISSKGSYVHLFEQEFAAMVKAPYSVSVCNGTCALHLAMIALGIGPGDEVIVPTFTYIASVNAILYVGARPVFVDCQADTWQIDPEQVKKKISSATKAVMAVHLYGHPCDLTALTQTCQQHGVFLVEDCAEAIGSYYQDQHVGTFGDIAVFSFYGNKTITTGEGGMVVTKDEMLYERSLHYRGQGLAKYREYWHDVVGYNFRMTNICAAIGLAQLENVEKKLEKKRLLAQGYAQRLKGHALELHREIGPVRHSYWMCSVLVESQTQRDLTRQKLAKAGIETRPLFYPIHTMPMFASRYERHPHSESISLRGMNLPSYPDLGEADLDYICAQLVNALQS